MKQLKVKKLGFFSPFLFALLLVASGNFASAQVSASISGRIEDPSGAAIPGATVTATSLETGAERTVTADEAGSYRILSLPVGPYEVRAEKTGFKAVVQKGINLAVGQQAVVNVNLEVGVVQQEVTVTGEAPLVNTTTATVAGLVGEKQVKELPLNGRSFDNLITLNAGAINFTTMRIAGTANSAIGNLFSVGGRRPQENLFLLNGVEYTGPNLTHASPGGVSGQLLGIDAVREFNVVSDTYSAEYGKRAGAQVSVVTQSGTNQFHGAAFEFLRNSDLDARNFFDQGTIAPFKRNQFGGAGGGPIQKDRTFIFGNYEGFRQRLGISDVTIVPDDNARRGLLPDDKGAPAPVPGLDPGMLPYMAFWPVANGPELLVNGLPTGTALTFSNPKQSIREDFGTVRLDHNFSGKDSLSGIYTVDDGDNLTPNTNPVFAVITTLRSQVLSLQETHIFSPNVINTFTAGFSRVGFFFNSPPLGSFPSSLSFVQGQIPGNVTIGSGQNVSTAAAITPAGASVVPHLADQKSLFTYGNGLQVIKGRHQISLGVWFQRLRSNESGVARVAGQATFPSLQSFLQGNVATFSVVVNPIPHAWRQLEGAWYLQDAIQVRPNLTLRLGLRHEFTNGWNEATGRAARFVFDPNGVLVTTPTVGNSAFTENNARWLFAPRVGWAWDPFGKGKTSIRAGLGTYYDLQDALGFIMNAIPPFNGVISFQSVPLLSLVPIVPTTPLPPTCGPGVPRPCTTYAPRGVPPTMKTPTVQGWSFAVEQQITPNTAFRASYAGSHAYHQLITLDPNSIQPAICSDPSGCQSGGVGAATGIVPNGAEYIPIRTRPNPYLANGNFWFSEGNASYNSLRMELLHRFSQGLQFRANYTWAKDLNIATGVTSADAVNDPPSVMDPYHPRRDWGPSAQDVRNQFSFSGSYEFPFGHGKTWLRGASGAKDRLVSGWQLNSIVALLSGFPVTPLAGSNRSGNGDAMTSDRPSLNPAFTGPVTIGNPNQWFNPKAYVLPVPGTWGDLGRGVLRGPGLATLDLSMFKSTPLSERVSLQFRAEFFNLLNRANFGTPNPTVFTGGAINPSAGVVTNTATTSRQIQFGLKLIF